MVKYSKSIIAFVITLAFVGSLHARTSNESLNSRNKWKKWTTYDSNYTGNIIKGRVIRFKRNSIRHPFEFGGPVFKDNRIYVGVHEKMFYAVDVKPRKKRWAAKTVGEIETVPAVNNDVVFVGDGDGYVYAWQTDEGKEVWKINLEEPVSSSPVISDGVLYIMTSTGRLFAIDEKLGKEIWHTVPRERLIGFTLIGSPVPIVKNDKVYFGTPDGTILCYSKNGDMIWEAPVGDESSQISDVGGLAVDDKNLYAAIADGRVVALDLKKGNIIWELPIEGAYAIAISDNNTLYVSGGKTLYALNAENGLPVWEQEFENTVGLSPPAFGSNFVAVSSTKKQLFILSPDDGEIVLNRFLRGGSFTEPFTDGKKIYVLSNASRLYSFEVEVKAKKKK